MKKKIYIATFISLSFLSLLLFFERVEVISKIPNWLGIPLSFLSSTLLYFARHYDRHKDDLISILKKYFSNHKK